MANNVLPARLGSSCAPTPSADGVAAHVAARSRRSCSSGSSTGSRCWPSWSSAPSSCGRAGPDLGGGRSRAPSTWASSAGWSSSGRGAGLGLLTGGARRLPDRIGGPARRLLDSFAPGSTSWAMPGPSLLTALLSLLIWLVNAAGRGPCSAPSRSTCRSTPLPRARHRSRSRSSCPRRRATSAPSRRAPSGRSRSSGCPRRDGAVALDRLPPGELHADHRRRARLPERAEPHPGGAPDGRRQSREPPRRPGEGGPTRSPAIASRSSSRSTTRRTTSAPCWTSLGTSWKASGARTS